MSVSKIEILREMEYAVTHIRERVLDEKARGHKVIGCLPILIPEELVHASGAFPVGIWGAERLPIVRAAEYYPPTPALWYSPLQSWPLPARMTV